MDRSCLNLSLLTVVLLAIGCRSGPCETALRQEAVEVGTGDASIRLRAIHQESPTGQGTGTVDCYALLMLSSDSYSDTLVNVHVAPTAGSITVTGLPVAPIDVIVSRTGYFPSKLTELAPAPAAPGPEVRVFLYPADVPFALPGEIGLKLKPSASIDAVEPLIRSAGDVEVRRTPEAGFFELKIPVRDLRLTKAATARLIRRLQDSPLVKDAAPLVSMAAVLPGL